MTNRVGVLDLKNTLDAFLADEASREPGHAYHFRQEHDLSISIDLS
jgi:hypothetical protein